MQLAKRGFDDLGAATQKTVMFQNQGNTVYDIYGVIWAASSTSLLATSELVVAALSTRAVDQNEGTVAIGFDTLATAQDLFAVFTWAGHVVTEGGAFLIGTRPIMFPKPLTVPFLAVVAEAAVATIVRLGCEVYYERRQVSAGDKAEIVAQTGGRVHTS